jgi:hypothetical protein
MSRACATLGLIVACLALAATGCGSASSTQATTSPGGQGGGGEGSQGRSGIAPSTDDSIQTYGSAAGSGEKAALAATALSFFRALAGADYAKVCAALSSSNRQQLQAFQSQADQGTGCAAILKTLAPSFAAAAARKAAQGVVTGVRIKGDAAFVLFRPAGGPSSYFVLKREGGAWKAISLEPGTPLQLPMTPR